MLGIKVEITKFVEGGYPGVVECLLVDADGTTHLFHDKVPVVALKNLDEHSTYPTDGIIACEIVTTCGDDSAEVSTEFPWHVESTEGQTRFKPKEQLRDFGPEDFEKVMQVAHEVQKVPHEGQKVRDEA